MKWPYSRSVQAGIWTSAAARVSAAVVIPAGDPCGSDVDHGRVGHWIGPRRSDCGPASGAVLAPLLSPMATPDAIQSLSVNCEGSSGRRRRQRWRCSPDATGSIAPVTTAQRTAIRTVHDGPALPYF